MTTFNKQYYLIQVAEIKRSSELTRNATLLYSLDMEYMGSTEFEFGAIPKALGRFLADTETKVFGKVELDDQSPFIQYADHTDRFKKTPIAIRYLVRESQEAKLVEFLKDFNVRRRSLKERAYFIDSSGKGSRVWFGIDSGLEFFAWTGKRFKGMLLKKIPKSAKVLQENNWMPAIEQTTAEDILKLKSVLYRTNQPNHKKED